MLEPTEEAAARASKKAGERAVKESVQPLARTLEGGDGTPKGASAPQLEEADRKANAKVKTDWQFS